MGKTDLESKLETLATTLIERAGNETDADAVLQFSRSVEHVVSALSTVRRLDKDVPLAVAA